MASLLSWGRLSNTFKNDVLNPINRDVVQPVVHAAPAPVRGVANAVAQNVGGIIGPGYHAAVALNPLNMGINTVKAGAGLLTGNDKAAYNAVNPYLNIGRNFRQLGQGTIGQGVQLAESVNPYGGDVYKRQVVPTGGFQKFVLGNQPIPSMQNAFQQNKQQGGKAYAGTQAGITALMDALAVHGAAKSGVKFAQNATPLNEIGAVGKNVNPEEAKLAALAKQNAHPGEALQRVDQLNKATLAAEEAPKLKSPPPIKQGSEALDYQALRNKVLNAKAEVPGKLTPGLLDGKGQPTVGVHLENTNEFAKVTPDQLKTLVKEVKNIPSTTKDNVHLSQLSKLTKSDYKEIPLKDLASKSPNLKKALAPNLNADMFSKENIAKYEKLNAEDKANLPPNEQMALAELEGKGPVATKLAPPEVNTSKNPYKSPVTQVRPGDYGHAIANSQVVSRPIDTARTGWEHTMKQLQKTSPGEYKNFWRAVEDPANKNHSPVLQEAISRWRAVDNAVHGNSQALGGNTNYLTNHALHPWQLPEEYTQHIINGGSPTDFKGLNNISRKYLTINDAPAYMKLGTDPLGEGSRYLQANSSILRKTALKQGLAAADQLSTTKPFTRDLGNGHTVQLSKEGFEATKGVQYSKPTSNAVVRGVRTGNVATKSSILSLGQFHTINIGALRAAPTLIAEGHPVAAAKGLYGMFRGAVGTEYADRVIGNAIKDGTVDKAALIGMPYGSGGYATEGSFMKGGIGQKTVFGKQIPMMHDQVARSIISDLQDKGIPLDSLAARVAGKAGANLMGELNHEAQNISPQVRRAMGDWMLAGQFTPSKFSQLGTAFTKGGIGGSYARANVAANIAATTAIIGGLGYVAKQKSDDIKDILLRALIDPAVPTPNIDAKGNTVKLRLPGTDTSDIAKLLGIKLTRNPDGHLGVNWSPGNMPSTVADFLRARLSPFASAGVKVATNTTFASKPLYDPNAPAGTKGSQIATSLLTSDLPIGLQGVPQLGAVKNRLPGTAQEILNAQSPGTNPLIKSIGSSFGLTPTTDMTTGKALDTSRYFNALGQATQGLNSQEQAALKLFTGSKKNPVTGKYDVQPNVNDTTSKASALLQNPKVIDNLITMNQKLSSQGQKTDPLWQQSKDQITKVLQYQRMPPGGADRTHWYNQNKDWYQPLADARGKFFGTLPPGDPNKPKAPIEYPSASPDIAQKQKTFFGLQDASSRAQYIAANPDLQQQLDNQVKYNNDMRTAQGYGALDTFPTATPQVQKIIDTYNAIPKGGGKKGGNLYRAQWIQSHPNDYAAMTKYFTQASLYGAQQSLAQAQFKDTGVSQAGLKDIYNLGQYDITKTTDANGNTFSLGGNSSSKYASSGSKPKSISFKATSIKAPKLPKGIRVARAKAFKAPTTRKLAVSKIPSSYSRKKLA